MATIKQIVAVAVSARGTGRLVEGVLVEVVHSKLGRLFQGYTAPDGLIAFARSYDEESESGTHMTVRASFPGAVSAAGRLITKTLVTGAVTGAYQWLALVKFPRRRFGG